MKTLLIQILLTLLVLGCLGWAQAKPDCASALAARTRPDPAGPSLCIKNFY